MVGVGVGVGVGEGVGVGVMVGVGLGVGVTTGMIRACPESLFIISELTSTASKSEA